MAALACLSEHPAAIQRCFLTRERNVRGCYRIQLYDGQKKQFVKLSIDDFLPTENDQPLFAKPKGSELWVLLLEKAFAKLFGDYHSLEGGHLAVAFEAMTGVSVCALVHAGSTGPIESSKSSNNSELSTLLELNAEAPRV
jgi:calpain-15